MRFGTILLALIAVAIAGCGSAGPRLVTFGHSFVAGTSGGPAGSQLWADIAASDLHRTLDNQGVAGTTSAQIEQRVLAYQPKRGDVVTIEAMMNDLLTEGTSATGIAAYKAHLSAMIRHLRASRPAPREILLLSDPRPIELRGGTTETGAYTHGSDAAFAAYRAATSAVGRSAHVRVVDLDQDWMPSIDILRSDGLHPNVAGNRLIAARVASALGS